MFQWLAGLQMKEKNSVLTSLITVNLTIFMDHVTCYTNAFYYLIGGVPTSPKMPSTPIFIKPIISREQAELENEICITLTTKYHLEAAQRHYQLILLELESALQNDRFSDDPYLCRHLYEKDFLDILSSQVVPRYEIDIKNAERKLQILYEKVDRFKTL